MRLKHLLLALLLSVPTSTLAQEVPMPQEGQIQQETNTSQDGLVTEQKQVSQDAQPANTQSAQTKKTENPPEPESHGTRLHWQDIPRNVLHDQKAIFMSPFHINRENA